MANEEILYEGRKIKIIYSPKEDTHYLIISGISGRHLIKLGRGVLDELSRTPEEGLESKLNAVDSSSKDIFQREGLTYDSIGFAIAQARLIEVNRELNYAYSTLNKRTYSSLNP